MHRKVLGVIARHKFAAVCLLMLIVAIAVIALSRTDKLVVQPLVSVPASTAPIEPTTEPTIESKAVADAEVPSSSPDTSIPPEFRYAVCQADIRWFPNASGTTGYTPIEHPAFQSLKGISQVSAGHLFDEAGYGMQFGTSYALAKDGTVYQWGVLDWGSGIRSTAFPQKVEELPSRVIQLDGRFALTEIGDVYDVNAKGGPKAVAGLSGAVAIAQAEDSSVYVLHRNGGIKRYSIHGPNDNSIVEKVDGFHEVRSIAAGPFIMLAIDKEGTLWQKSSHPEAAPVPIVLPDGLRAERVEVTMSHEYPVYIESDKGRWFRMTYQGMLEPAVVPEGTVQVTATGRTMVALKADGSVWAWGDSPNLLKPEGQRVSPEHPKKIAGLEDVTTLAVGSDHLLALTKQGRVLTIGSNMYGQLGRMPIYAKDPLSVGSWLGLDGLFPVYGGVFATIGGDLWMQSDDGSIKPIVLGQNAVKAMNALGHFAVLTGDGRLLVAEPEETKPCKVLQAPEAIIDAAAASNGLLLAMKEGRVVYLEGSTTQLFRATDLKFDPEPAGKVLRVFGDPIPFALTDKGELYYKQRTQDGVPIMGPVEAGVHFKQWSPIHYVFFDGIGYIGKALDVRNQVYDIELKLNRDGDPAHETASVTAKKTDRTAESMTGGLEIAADGRLLEKIGNMSIDSQLPSGIELRTAASFYHFPIEGRSFRYHLFATEDGTLYRLGELPYTGIQTEAGAVVLP